jgi:hypothetical protein
MVPPSVRDAATGTGAAGGDGRIIQRNTPPPARTVKTTAQTPTRLPVVRTGTWTVVSVGTLARFRSRSAFFSASRMYDISSFGSD